jgi:ribose 5-phosphate isomerase B
MTDAIAIGGDHAGFEYKEKLIKTLTDKGYTLRDFGPETGDAVDYPDYIHPLCNSVESGDISRGIVICGSGNGVAITANKHQGIRAALCWNVALAELSRKHNNANLIAIPARFVDFDLAVEMVLAFLNTDFEGGRHAQRVNKIPC